MLATSNSSLIAKANPRISEISTDTDEFKALLDLLSIKYIVQRNDVNGYHT
jgi:hypothetical protein